MIDKVQVDAVLYNIEQTNEPMIIDGKLCNGKVEYTLNKITIQKTLGEQYKKVTLMHEIVHAITYERNMLPLDKCTNELVVDEIAKGMLSVIKLNPQLVDYLCNDDNKNKRKGDHICQKQAQ